MKHKIIDGIVFLILIGVPFSAILGIGAGYGYLECKAKAKALGHKADYGIIQGCVLEKPNGKRILLEQLRDVGD